MIYKKKITNDIVFISALILILCNINFTIENILFTNEEENNDTYNKIFMKYWNKTLSWINKDKLKKIYVFTQYFSEILVISYFIIIMLYIHYK